MKRTTAVDPEELEGLALEFGATLEYDDGNVFNVSGRRGTRLPKPEEPEQDKVGELLQKVSELASRPIEVKVEAPAPAAATPAKVSAWTFEFERNDDGTIKRIHATPKD
jgi:hypothetical protein